MLWQPSAASIGMQLAFLVAGHSDAHPRANCRLVSRRLLGTLLVTRCARTRRRCVLEHLVERSVTRTGVRRSLVYAVCVVWNFYIVPRQRVDKRWWPAFQRAATSQGSSAVLVSVIMARTWSLSW